MKFTAHIGLGKTGTSAIQFALQEYKGNLTAGKTGLGRLWPILPDGNRMNHEWLVSQHTAEKTKALYKIIVSHSKKTGCDHVFWSNEAISNTPEAVKLLRHLSTWSPDLDVQIILYVRAPGQWLKSAWEQWGLRHKVLEGKIFERRRRMDEKILRSMTLPRWFHEFGAGTYNSWKWWRKIAEIRQYKEGENIIDDFCEVTGLDLPRIRAYETPSSSEILSRAIYNNTYSDPVTPHMFDTYVNYGSVQEYSKNYFSLKDIERLAMILRDESISFQNDPPPKERKISEEDYKRLVDQAIIFSIEAMGRIDQLEDKVKELSDQLNNTSENDGP
tara:strand:+ start:16597 stop:17586 length:990 start_codon:yes stop_codon:yes gene_type:complete